ncbi:MAG: cell wall endopeptidase family [Candidatus Saccharibacteria bacterium]|nr:cell wall endopeptidase family [Candidatus Saccharibacteria bacterium]
MKRRYKPIHLFLEKTRWFIFGIPLVLVSLVIISLVAPTTETNARAATATTTDSPADAYTMGSYDSANAVTNGLTATADGFDAAIISTERTLMHGSRSIVANLSRSGTFITRSLHTSIAFVGRTIAGTTSFMGRGIVVSATFMAKAVVSSFTLLIKIPATILGFVADTPLVSAAIKPADDAPTPVIDQNSPTLFAAKTNVPSVNTVNKTAPQIDTSPAWPIHGEITTYFGVPHWPFQPTHTGLDISDGRPSGVTPVKPYRAGRVIETVHSNSGLGNHVIVDHGDGITSVYAHFATISVSTGQIVDKSTVLGTEGSTGASTGPHVHIEIRVNGQPTDPLKYLQGHP